MVRYLVPIYVCAAAVAPISMALPTFVLPLDHREAERWSDGVVQALLFDVLLLQPLVHLARLLWSEASLRVRGQRRHRILAP